MQIKDHVFIVTGASSGIGLSTAIALSDRGAKVALLARSTEALQKLAQRLAGSARPGLRIQRTASIINFYTPSDSYRDEMEFDREVLEKARAAFQARRDTEAAQRPCPHGSLESKATLGCDSALPAVGKDAVGADHHC